MGNHKLKKRNILLPVMLLFVLLLISLTIKTFLDQIQKNETAIADNNLRVAANNCVSRVQQTFDGYYTVLETMSKMLVLQRDITSEQVLIGLQKIAEENNCRRVSIDFPNGKSVASDGSVSIISNKELLERIAKVANCRSL